MFRHVHLYVVNHLPFLLKEWINQLELCYIIDTVKIFNLNLWKNEKFFILKKFIDIIHFLFNYQQLFVT
jgi:hypothetical protein